MTEEELNTLVHLSCQRALLGVITPNLRMVTIGWQNLQLFRIRAYFDIVPSEKQIEDLEAVNAEIISDIPFEKDKVECVFSDVLMKDLEVFKYIVFSRKE